MAEPSPNTLELIAELRTCLRTRPRDVARCWELAESVGGSFLDDARCSDRERFLVERLKSGVSDVIAAERDGLEPDVGLATVPLSALEAAVRRRTTGEDGWPLG